MTALDSWSEDAYFPEAQSRSIDMGTTNLGPLWHSVSVRWGHSMHTMCPYQGMFPPKLAHYFIQRFSMPGATVIDPFSGRGTTVLQARAEGRIAIGNDLNPLAYVLSKAKVRPPRWDQVCRVLDGLERDFRATKHPQADVVPDIAMLYHPHTLKQICFLRDWLLSSSMTSWDVSKLMIAGTMAGILHGGVRVDGSSQYLSISMPNTFSMSPSYVRKYIDDYALDAPTQNVFARLREKLARLYADDAEGPPGRVSHRDAIRFLTSSALEGKADLLLTSPPYLKVVNYGTSNWIRLWWLGIEDVGRQSGSGRRRLDAALDHGHGYEAYRSFILRVLMGVESALAPDGVAAIVIGDVASPGEQSLALAGQLWSDLGDEVGLDLLYFIEDDLPPQNKVSRIWGDTKGQATDRDCVLLLAKPEATPIDKADVTWGEPYRDAGPDAAHDLLRNRIMGQSE